MSKVELHKTVPSGKWTLSAMDSARKATADTVNGFVSAETLNLDNHMINANK